MKGHKTMLPAIEKYRIAKKEVGTKNTMNDNYLFQNQQWLNWPLQLTRPFPSDAGFPFFIFSSNMAFLHSKQIYPSIFIASPAWRKFHFHLKIPSKFLALLPPHLNTPSTEPEKRKQNFPHHPSPRVNLHNFIFSEVLGKSFSGRILNFL